MKLSIRPLALPEIKLISAPRFRDPRGYFAETYVRCDFAAAGIPHEFVQDNESLSHAPGTVRGLHFQIPPFAQAKLVRVLTGRIFDACVDLRRSSPRYALIARGAFVINVDKLTYAANPRSLDAIAHDPRYAFERLDICDRAAMDAVLAKYRPSAVLHLAAESHVDRSITGAAAFIDTNIT